MPQQSREDPGLAAWRNHGVQLGGGIQYKVPMRDINFCMREVLDMPAHWKELGYEVDGEDASAMLQMFANFCEEKLVPCNQVGDAQGCYRDEEGRVYTPDGFKEAYEQYCADGWQSMTVPEEYGGMAMPMSLGLIKQEMAATANWSWSMYPGLSLGCANTLLLHGSEAQKERYLPKLASGEWSGTMCLTEPHCGTDLAQVRTKAVKQADGTYRLSGQKIFISSGEHDLSENIVHIVLAKIEGASEGVKGISLFLVPRHLDAADGDTLEAGRNLTCGSIEHKMGIAGSATCVMNFDDSVGYLIGEPEQGLRQMFTFMNTARIGTGLQGIAHAEAGFQGALSYARDRQSMRALSGPKHPELAADPIIVHPDVRRMLLTTKAIAEGSRMLVYDVAKRGDGMLLARTAAEHKQVDRDLGVLTPILKAFTTELGLEAANLGMQCFGGHGYIQEWGMEQNARDARIGTLYEGTTGIQALDLLGRKVLLDGGKGLKVLMKEMLAECSASSLPERWALRKEVARWAALTARVALKAKKDKDEVGGAAYDYCMFAGYVTMAYEWLRMMNAAEKALASNPSDAAFYEAKLQTGRFYFERLLPRASSHATLATQPLSSLMDMSVEGFSHGSTSA